VSYQGLKYFQIFVPTAGNFSVLVEICSGDTALYMSQDSYKPSPTQYRYDSDNTDKNDFLEVKDDSIVNSEFYIGIYGKANTVSDYIITAWTETPSNTGPIVNNSVILTKSHYDSIDLQFFSCQFYY